MGNIKLFQNQKVRTYWDKTEQQWYFSLVDVVEILTDSKNPTDYLKKVRKRDDELNKYIGTNCPQVEMITSTGKIRKTLAGNAEHLFRVIQSIPSPKAEPFKQWLAKVGYERVQEIENPELAQERMKLIYEQKGYPSDWIDKRLRGIAIRQNLTDEWKERGIQSDNDYAILTAEISKATFGLTPTEYKDLKGLTKKSQNLRDHMTDLELIFTMLGERVTTEISKKEKPGTFPENKLVARRGGKVAGVAREETEKELGRSIISDQNFLEHTENDEPLPLTE
ncbi:MAG TPA: Bro-N domain-containing protein [Prolixibacteraceae bacterium]|nr:Bro-N domain-containing protein [Prolixibacteraceae bacterium]